MKKLTLSETDVTDIVMQRFGHDAKTIVKVAALDYNWGPPISGRTDGGDFLQLWAIARSSVNPVSLKVLGTYSSDTLSGARAWSDKIELHAVKECAGFNLYYVDFPTPLPEQFVLKLETADGSVFYDNNGGYGLNYQLTPWKFRGTTAIAGDGAIRVLDAITPVALLWRDYENQSR